MGDKEDELLFDDGNTLTEGKSEDIQDENLGLMALLASMNKNMEVMSESLKQIHNKGETQTPKSAESARKRKAPITDDESEHEESDAEKLLSEKKRQKVVDNEEDEDPLLDEIAQSLTETEKTEPKVSDKLAKIINSRWLNKLNEDQLKEKAEKYLRPINCDQLITPKVNPEIWGRLDRQTRGKDLKLSTLQTTLTKVGNITARITDMLLKARNENSQPDIEGIIRMNTDSIALLGHISFELSQRRRDAIRPTLNKDYQTLCASHVPVTAMLFGDELQTQLNHIRASNKISSTASTSSSQDVNRRHYKPQASRSAKPFLGKSPQGNHSFNPAYKKNYYNNKKRFAQTTDQK